jgi:DNA gyrase inhibitor GyrI
MNLSENYEKINWPETHYVFIEKIGPFMKTAPLAWEEMNALVPKISERNVITGFLSLYIVEDEQYRAGVSLAGPPKALPEGLTYELFRGGAYARFVLTGPYSDLPEACGRIFSLVEQKRIALRDDFCIEHYVTDPKTAPPEKLITEILLPLA